MNTQVKRVLDVVNLQVSFDTPDGTVDAVKGVSFHINKGECVGIVGESGSGKSQTFMVAMGLLAKNGRANGKILFQDHDLLALSTKDLNTVRGRNISLFFRDPLTSLTPHMTILAQMREVIDLHMGWKQFSTSRGMIIPKCC